jgi:DNA (cytosine-5)-methyltransferase 1
LKVLELFACAGGSTRGIVAADNVVVATDIDPKYLEANPMSKPYPHAGEPEGGREAPVRQPWEWTGSYLDSVTEALDYEAAIEKYGDWADWVWASPPCQLHTKARHLVTQDYLDLVAPTRAALKELGKPYVIENVPDAPLHDPIELCGCMFYGLRVYRPRHFEINLMDEDLRATAPNHAPHTQVHSKMGLPAEFGKRMHVAGHNSNLPITRAAMGYDYTADKIESRMMSESIPPAYAYYVAQEMARLLT